MSEFNRAAHLKRYWLATATGLSIILCLEWNSVNIVDLFDSEGANNAKNIIEGLSSPNLEADFLLRILQLSLESFFIGILGTAAAVMLGIVLSIFAIRLPALAEAPGKTSFIFQCSRWLIRALARFLMGFFRSIPEVVWAYLFVQLLGLGPGPAVLAIMLTVGGSIGKLFAELAEASNAKLVLSIEATGATRWGILLYGIIPQVVRQWTAYALFRMECNIRTGTILGVVGAGGLGTEIVLSIRYMQFDKLATALIAVLVFVIALEQLSSLLRRKAVKWSLVFAVLSSSIGLYYLQIPWMALFGGSLWLTLPGPPNLNYEFIQSSLMLVVDTIAMAWVATMAAGFFAFFLAPLATHQLITKSYLTNAFQGKGYGSVLMKFLFFSVRFSLQISRAIPELTLALIFVVWVGPGALAGILAIALHNIGVLGRLYTDVYEEVESGPARALQACGVRGFGVWLYSVLPQVGPRLLTFTLYRFEVNIRATATLGFVGAGGIGDALHTAISLFQLADLAALLFVMLIVVTVVDTIGDRMRKNVLAGV